MKLINYNCCICSKPLIGLIRQDIKLDPYYLTQTSEDLEVLEKGIYGSVHQKCLQKNSTNLNFWRKRIFDSLLKGGDEKFNDDILINKNSFEIVSFENKEIIAVKKIEIQSINSSRNTINLEHEINVDFSSLTNKEVKNIKNKLIDNQSFCLIELIDILKINDFILNIDSLVDAVIRPLIEDEEETFITLDNKFFTGTCTYSMPVSSELICCLEQL